MRYADSFQSTLRVVLLSLTVLSGPAQGDIVVDFPGHWTQIQYSMRIGQTFVSVDESIHTISLGINDLNRYTFPQDHNLSLILRSGSGLDGKELGSVTVDNIPDDYEDWLDFVFNPPLSVTNGATYTLEVVDDTARWGIGISIASNPYPEGYAWLRGAVLTNSDLGFRVFSEFRPGVCCLGESCLADTDATICTKLDGIHAGTGTTCDSDICVPGACCDYYWGSCDMRLPKFCRLGTYQFTERGVACDEGACSFIGHCCQETKCTSYVQRADCELGGGLWLGSSGSCNPGTCPPCQSGSLDFDDDYDLEDVQAMQICQGLGAGGGCLCADFDGDRSIDLPDFATFSTLLEGPE